MTDQVVKFEPVISRIGAIIATQFTISTNSRTLDPMPIITPVAQQSIPEATLCTQNVFDDKCFDKENCDHGWMMDGRIICEQLH